MWIVYFRVVDGCGDWVGVAGTLDFGVPVLDVGELNVVLSSFLVGEPERDQQCKWSLFP